MNFKNSLMCFLCVYAYNVSAFFEYRQAVDAYKAQHYAQALEQFETLLTQNPDDYELNYNAGKAAYQQHEYQIASSYFKEALKQADIPADFAMQAWFDLGNTFVKQKNWQDALASYEKVLTYDPEHQEAKDMIEKIKKLLQEKEREQNQQDQQQQSSDENNKQDQNQSEQKNQQSSPKNNNENASENQQEPSSPEQSQEQNAQQEKADDNASKNDQSRDKQLNKDGKSDKQQSSGQDAQQGASNDQNEKKQDLSQKDMKKSGKEKGQEGTSNNNKENAQHGAGNDLEQSMPDIQDHERQGNNVDHAASPTQKESQSKKQDTPAKAKSQVTAIDPFALKDAIDKDSREGKILQLIEVRDAQAAQQLLKMNVQMQRKPGEKNW